MGTRLHYRLFLTTLRRGLVEEPLLSVSSVTKGLAVCNDETVKKLIQALETVSILYETYFKLIIATGMRRGECCALKWEDINYAERSIHVCRNAVKTTGDEIIVKAPKTKAGK